MPGEATGEASREVGESHRSTWSLVALKLAASGFALAVGFRGISDDDYARVVIAQHFAHAPSLDPSGTSWLPLPFWINGAAMMLLPPTIETARLVAVVLGVMSVVLVREAGLWMGLDRRAAWLGAAIAAVLPWSVRLGVSAVPELPTAAMSLLALASLVGAPRGARRLAGGALLLASSLSRYEPWFLAMGFAAIHGFDLARGAFTTGRERRLAGLGLVLALGGPLLWSAWNHVAHGSATHYVDRVAAYKQAIDQGATLERATSYVLATFRAEPELVVLTALVAVRLGRGRWPQFAEELANFRRPVALVGVLFVTLTASSLKGGAPTHHPERALLVLHLLMATAVGALVARAQLLGRLGSARSWLWTVVLFAPLVFFGRRWFLYREHFAQRDHEIALGERIAERIEPGRRVFVEALDYGHFAVEAASTRPWNIVRSGPIHPASGGTPVDAADLAPRARDAGASFVVGRHHADASGLVVLAQSGGLALYALEGER